MRFAPHMDAALAEARAAFARAETPVGAVIVDPRERPHRRPRRQPHPRAPRPDRPRRDAGDPRRLRRARPERLTGLDIYVTLEPCAMCAAAIAAARLARLCYGAADPKSGGVEHGARVFAHRQAHHKPEVFGGIEEREATALLRAFFAERR